MLINALIGLVVASIAISVVVTTGTQQHVEAKALTEKLAAVETQHLLYSVAADSRMCTSMIARAVGNTPIDTTNPDFEVNLQSLRPDGFSGPLATVNRAPSDISKTLIVKTIKLKKFTATGAPDKYFANLVIEYDETKTSGIRRPSVAKVVLSTTGPASNATIAGCSKNIFTGVSWTPPLRQNNCQWRQTCNSWVSCAANQYVAGINTHISSIGQMGATICSEFYCCEP